jgi:hypothetical protein
MTGDESGFRSQLQNLRDDLRAALFVTIRENDCRRSRAYGFKRNCSPYALRRPCDEQDFAINTNIHFSLFDLIAYNLDRRADDFGSTIIEPEAKPL